MLYSTGQTDYCKDCGRQIRYTGVYWEHVGVVLRHIAVPRMSEMKSKKEKIYCKHCGLEIYQVTRSQEWVHKGIPKKAHMAEPEN